MNKKYFFTCVLLALATGLFAQTADSVDVLHYDLNLRLRSNSTPHLSGCARLEIRLLTAMPRLQLDLKNATVDSVFVNGQRDSSASYTSPFLTVGTADATAGDTLVVDVHYRSNGYMESNGMGGLHFNSGIAYNLGIALREYPHNMGKAWFPCRDNFTDRASYTLQVNTEAGWTAQCGGTCDSVWMDDDGSQNTRWQLPQEIPTYLISITAAPWHIIERTFTGLYGTYPTTLGYLHHDSTTVQRTFDNLERVLPMYEQCFGPYRWGRIGYVSTPMGSMEHVNNICLHTAAMDNLTEVGQSTIVHELSHAWFGNLITCSSAADMWFNEGGASFCEEVAMQAIHTADGKPFYHREYYMNNLEKVIRTCHLDDGGGYRPLYDQPHYYTYGMTTYNKGALMWHSLRGYLGDSVFYAALRTLFERNAFQSMDGWSVRDSLAAYSHTNLDDFFNFYVYDGGFVDFIVDSTRYHNGTATLYLRQRLLGTETPMQGCRVPVTFVGTNGERQTFTASWDGPTATLDFPLPFAPAHVLVDADDTLTRACTSGNVAIDHRGNYRQMAAHFTCTATACGDSTSWLRIEHHWLPAEGAMPYGVVRQANRYWNIIGDISDETRISGTFHYTCEAGNNVSYPHLDYGFYERTNSRDSLRLLYRPDNQSAWQVVDASHGGTASDGRLNLNLLKTGEYTLAIVDTALLGITTVGQTESATVTLYPNPSTGNVTIDVTHPSTVTVVDMTGRTVIPATPLSAQHATLNVSLPKGIYLVRVEEKESHRSTSQKLVVQ